MREAEVSGEVKKRLMILLLSIACALAITACGKDTEGEWDWKEEYASEDKKEAEAPEKLQTEEVPVQKSGGRAFSGRRGAGRNSSTGGYGRGNTGGRRLGGFAGGLLLCLHADTDKPLGGYGKLLRDRQERYISPQFGLLKNGVCRGGYRRRRCKGTSGCI